MIDELIIYMPEAAFVEPYIKQSLPGVLLSDLETASNPGLAIMLSSTDIYGAGAYNMANEETPIDSSSAWATREAAFTKAIEQKGIKGIILRCADIIGTGMNGYPRELAEEIWRGVFYHFPNNDARRSVIHATDIAELIRAIAAEEVQLSGRVIYNITDGEHPTIHDYADALSYRMKDKRISNLSTGPQQMIGRLIYGRKRYARYTTNRTFSSEAAANDLAFHPTPVCQYLRTHNYDDSSL